jgi:hypothetical protein
VTTAALANRPVTTSVPAAPAGPAAPAAADGGGADGSRPRLTLVTSPASPASTWRRRGTALVIVVALIFLLVAAAGRIAASADLEDRVAGHVVIEPGQTLWDVAVATAPEGSDPRAQLVAIQELNGITAGEVGAWTVVLLPTR